ncbi:ocs element-binding factor 1-like [Phragmites australis]|uniref:ocs element-binding factor 1-like n=1 Tax=Phragmites australis TaxID=29695 RepID=UPI002D7840F2|nr:ocs element-binding factor 1-like [Phragmites australis]
MSSSSLSPTGRMSGSDGDSAADTHRREKRRLSNRESARRSRLRKQQHLDELVQEVARLQAENARAASRAAGIAAQYSCVEQENTVLRARAAELSDRLRSFNEVLRVFEEFSGVAMDIQEELPADDPLLRPWQLPCPAAAMPIGATAAHMLHY